MLSPLRNSPPRLLQDHPVFVSRDVDEARAQVARMFCAHQLQTLGPAQPLECRMRHVALGALSLNYLTYGAEVAIAPGCLENFYLVQIPLCGQAEVRYGAQHADSNVNTAVILSPHQPINMRWHSGCAQLILHIPRPLIEQLVATDPHEPSAPLEFALPLAQGSGPTAGWCQMVRDLARNIDAHGGAWLQHAAARSALQDMLLGGLLGLQPYQLSQAGDTHQPSAALPPYLQRAIDCIQAQAEQALGISDIARAACVSVRTLEEGFRRSLNTTPHAYLRRVRLQRIHGLLQQAARQGQPLSLFEVAYRFGFFHLGRFSAYYKAQFGVSPSATLRPH